MPLGCRVGVAVGGAGVVVREPEQSLADPLPFKGSCRLGAPDGVGPYSGGITLGAEVVGLPDGWVRVGLAERWPGWHG